MCRFLATKSTAPVRLRDLILKPAHSIIKQSEDSRLRLDQSPVNADGFGVRSRRSRDASPQLAC